MKKRKGTSLIVFVFGISAILALAGIVVDLGVLLNSQIELQKAVESASLVGASELEPQLNTDNTVSIDSSKIQDIATKTFNKMIEKNPLISNAVIIFDPDKDIKIKSKAIRVAASADTRTFFAKFAGFDKFTIYAKAAAISSPAYLSTKFPNGTGSIDTAGSDLRQPTGGNINQSWNNTTGGWDYGNVYGYPDNKALSLGPGGSIKIDLPSPIVDNSGTDLYIKQIGNLKGYYVFAGNDDSLNPSEIQWINISCTGIPVGTDQTGRVGAYYTDVNGNMQAKFYGSGYFDIGADCKDSNGNITYSSSIKNAKYLRIIDDNTEDGFMADNPEQPVILAGDHSSITPGVNIDAVALLHHTRLIDYYDLTKDTDEDGLIDIVEEITGTDPNKTDTDNDGINDAVEYIGWYGNNTDLTSGSSSQINTTNPLNADSTTAGIIKVK